MLNKNEEIIPVTTKRMGANMLTKVLGGEQLVYAITARLL